MGKRILKIGVLGPHQCSEKERRMGYEVGAGLAQAGAVLVCGGLGGVMEAACRGASAEGGTTIGILPSEDSLSANPHVQIAIATGMGYARNIVVAKSARAVIAVGGSYGTLSEIGYALQGGIPVIGLNTWSLSRNGREDRSIITAQSPAEAVEKALELASKKGGG